jgi:hypothetical protein
VRKVLDLSSVSPYLWPNISLGVRQAPPVKVTELVNADLDVRIEVPTAEEMISTTYSNSKADQTNQDHGVVHRVAWLDIYDLRH